MKTIIVKNYQELSKTAAELVIAQIASKPDTVLGLPTGQTPLGMYERLVNANQAKKVSFSAVKTFNLDEYVGLGKDDQDSYYSYMYGNLFVHVDIKSSNVHILDGQAVDLQTECLEFEQAIARSGGLDLLILGIGQNGHLGFCEPGTSFDSRTQVVDLSDNTRQVNQKQLIDLSETPKQALSMGLKTMMNAKRIVLLASGEHKQAAVYQALHGPVTENVPASVLQQHPDVLVIIDEAAQKEKEK
jgi:glucosamine-6-phosphate deaminase